MLALLRLCLVGSLALTPLLAAPVDSKTLLASATAAEAEKKFEKALDLYLRSYLAGERTAEVRDRIHDCLRQSAQMRRHRDADFRQFVLGLSTSESLSLYAEIVAKLSTHYAEKEKATPERLFELSLQEIERALADRMFRRNYLSGIPEAKLTRFAKSLKEDWTQRLPASPREARAALQELVKTAHAELGLREPAALVLEAICGASAGLDESNAYLAPHQIPERVNEPSLGRVEMLDAMAGVGRIEIRRFREGTPQEFEQALARLRMEGLRALVLDLRGNPGGSFPAALEVAERFIPNGILATTTSQLPEFRERVFSSTSGMSALDLPIVVLVDARTMSAAEVLAAALKDQGRATLIGTATFGKGTIQSPLPLGSQSAEGDAGPVKPRTGLLMVTIAKVLSGSGAPLQGVGVAPHVVEPSPTRQLELAAQSAAELAHGMR